MNDITLELRGLAAGLTPVSEAKVMREAANEIERLRAERDEARKECGRLARRNVSLVNELSERGRQFTPEQLKAAIVKALYESEG